MYIQWFLLYKATQLNNAGFVINIVNTSMNEKEILQTSLLKQGHLEPSLL